MSCAYKTKCGKVTTGQKELLTEMYRQASLLKAVVKLFVWRLHVPLLHLPLIPLNRRTGLNVAICTALSIQKIKLYTLCVQSIEMSIMVNHPAKDSILRWLTKSKSEVALLVCAQVNIFRENRHTKLKAEHFYNVRVLKVRWRVYGMGYITTPNSVQTNL